MTAKSKSNEPERNAFLWIVLMIGAIAGLFSLLTWPFRALIRRLPGRREKELQAEIDVLRKDIDAARLLFQMLRPDDPKSAARLEKRIGDAERKINEVVDAKGWPDELRKCLASLLKRRSLSLDWSFVKAIEAKGEAEALRHTNLLPVVGDQVEKLGFVLAQVMDGSDNHQFAVCSPGEFSKLDGLTCRSFSIRRLSSATGPAKEP